MYSIVEFNDGIFAIPSIWLSDDKKSSKWPPYDERKILKAISKKQEPDESWKFLNVIQIFGTACNYDDAIKKVSLAEQLTDISDSENAKKTRKTRAHRVLSSEDSDIEKHFTKKRYKRIGNTIKKAIDCESNIYPEFPSVPNSKSPLSENNELQRLSIKKENVILGKIHDLQKHFDNLDKSENTNYEKLHKNDEQQDNNIISLFPIKNTEQLKSFEENLKNKEFYKQVVTKLYCRGGKNVDEVVNKIMNLIFTNSFACNYSYFGKQKKEPFYDLILCKCVLDAIYQYNFHEKEDYTIKKIGFWLTNVPMRQAREKLKKEKLEKSKDEMVEKSIHLLSEDESN